MVLIGSDRFIEHQTPEGHPEQPARARVMQEVSRRWVERGGALRPPRPATRVNPRGQNEQEPQGTRPVARRRLLRWPSS